MFIDHKGIWWVYKDEKTGEYNGPEIRGSVLAYSTTTSPGKPAKKRKKG